MNITRVNGNVQYGDGMEQDTVYCRGGDGGRGEKVVGEGREETVEGGRVTGKGDGEVRTRKGEGVML